MVSDIRTLPYLLYVTQLRKLLKNLFFNIVGSRFRCCQSCDQAVPICV